MWRKEEEFLCRINRSRCLGSNLESQFYCKVQYIYFKYVQACVSFLGFCRNTGERHAGSHGGGAAMFISIPLLFRVLWA